MTIILYRVNLRVAAGTTEPPKSAGVGLAARTLRRPGTVELCTYRRLVAAWQKGGPPAASLPASGDNLSGRRGFDRRRLAASCRPAHVKLVKMSLGVIYLRPLMFPSIAARQAQFADCGLRLKMY